VDLAAHLADNWGWRAAGSGIGLLKRSFYKRRPEEVGGSFVNSNDFVLFALQLITMLACAVFLGQLMRRFHQPAVVGEMFGGIILGPTVFGAIAPGLYFQLFQASANVTTAREASIKMGMLFFLFIAGSEVNLSDLRRLGRGAALIGLMGTLIPIAAGVGLVYLIPHGFWGEAANKHFFSFALFVGMNLANSANPVIARILMDLGLLKEGIGAVIMTATIVDDLVNWTLFVIILRDIAPANQENANLPLSIALVLLFFVVIIGLGRWLGPRALRLVKDKAAWPSGFLALTTLIILAAGSVAEKLGIHAFLGAFLAGIALGGSDRESKEAHEVFSHFALSFFAPIYFVSMGLGVNFITNLDVTLVVLITALACASKIAGVLVGAKMARMPIGRHVLAISFGLNARGATGIILAGVGFEYKVIDARIFVSMVVMALVTSLMSGPMMKLLLPKEYSMLPAHAKSNAASITGRG
jgi:Kef-type K+ transport system membrane component KefB